LIAGLFYFFLAVESVIFVAVLGFLFYSLWRRREATLVQPQKPDPASDRRSVVLVSTAVAISVLILSTFVGMSYVVDEKLIDLDRDASVEIELTAHQWWWEVRYLNKKTSEIFTTANEIHVPVGEKIRLILKSTDVVHSLWIPNLSGKRDIIPGRDQDLYIRPDREGQWLGRCGEFCGLQHAYMGLIVFAEPKAKYEAWRAAQLQPAAAPVTLEEKHGHEVFDKGACNVCHTIRQIESTSQSNNAPDLTHLKSRVTIGAGAAKNTKGHLGGWILNPHGIKPGVHMPAILQEPKDFQALLSYLETLK
jgi:cytochrome c oxidase subunit 2